MMNRQMKPFGQQVLQHLAILIDADVLRDAAGDIDASRAQPPRRGELIVMEAVCHRDEVEQVDIPHRHEARIGAAGAAVYGAGSRRGISGADGNGFEASLCEE